MIVAGETSPAKTVRLVPDCEVVVIPKPRITQQQTTTTTTTKTRETHSSDSLSNVSQRRQTPTIFRVQCIFGDNSQQLFQSQEHQNDMEDSTKVFVNVAHMKNFHWLDGDLVTLYPLIPKEKKQQNNTRFSSSLLPQKVFSFFLFSHRHKLSHSFSLYSTI
jgi:hypothetical protein